MDHYKELQRRYDHAQDTIWSLFKFGRDRELAMEAKLSQIEIICSQTLRDARTRLDEIYEIINNHRNGV